MLLEALIFLENEYAAAKESRTPNLLARWRPVGAEKGSEESRHGGLAPEGDLEPTTAATLSRGRSAAPGAIPFRPLTTAQPVPEAERTSSGPASQRCSRGKHNNCAGDSVLG